MVRINRYTCVLAIAVLMLTAGIASAAPMSGAIFTTET
jgi:hypothetical protein